MAKAVVLPKPFTILLFFLGLAIALAAVDHVLAIVAALVDQLTGRVDSMDPTASIWGIIAAIVLVIILSKSAKSISTFLGGFVAGCLLRFLLMAGEVGLL